MTGDGMSDSLIFNPHLEGGPFIWEGGPTGVLLIHGYTATTAEVRPLASALYSQGYTISGPLLPGHNTRPKDANLYRWRDWMRTVEESYRQLAARCQRVAVGGESTGALLALYLAGEHPEVAAILAYAPALKLKMSPLQTALIRLLAPFVPCIRKGDMGDDPYWQGYRVYPLKGARELLRLQRQVRRCLARINRPLLLVQGRLDATVDPVASEIIHREVHSAVKELHWMPNSQHCVIIDREREQVNQLTLDFLHRAGA
jgi:carboxylesterase